MNPACGDCNHPAHDDDCTATVGYDHLNGDHECGCRMTEPRLTEAERLKLAFAVYSVTGYVPPKNADDLSSVKNEIEHMVERILAARTSTATADEVEKAYDNGLGDHRAHDCCTGRFALAEAVKDVCWRAQPYGETEDGDTYAYLVTKGAMHRLIHAAQIAGIPAAFRVSPDPLPDPATADTGLRERVEALCDEWEALADEDPYDPSDPGGYAADLRAALDATAAPTTDTGARDE